MVLPGRDVPWLAFGKALAREWDRDAVSLVAGSVTFFSILALFPFLICLIALAGLVIDPASAEELVGYLARVAPSEVVEILGGRIRALGTQESPGLLTVSALTAVWAASGGVNALISALNTAYGVKETRPFWKVRGLAILVTIGGALLAIVASAVAVAVPALSNRLGAPWDTVAELLRLPVAALLMMFVWACLYYFLPDVEQRFRFITPGSVVGVVIWVLASWGFSVYVRNFGKYDATYGTLGGVVVLLFWMWISSQVVLLGAEINAVLEPWSADGKRVGARTMQETGADATKSEKEERGEALLPRPGGTGPVQLQPPAALARRAAPPPPGRQRAAAYAAAIGLGVLIGSKLARR